MRGRERSDLCLEVVSGASQPNNPSPAQVKKVPTGLSRLTQVSDLVTI